MPTLKILVGNKLIDAELVVHEGALIPKVADEFLTSALPLTIAKYELHIQAADLVLEVGDSVKAAAERFPKMDKARGTDYAKMAAADYGPCRKLYEAGEFDAAKEKLLELKGHIWQNLASLELRAMVESELKKNPKTSKVKITRRNEQTVFHVAARFDGQRLWASLFGAKSVEPVGELVELPDPLVTMDIESSNPCSCNCVPPSIDMTGSVGYQIVIQRWFGANLECIEHKPPIGDVTNNFKSSTCSVDEGEARECYKTVYVFFPEGSS
jgi:hypothetical protein